MTQKSKTVVPERQREGKSRETRALTALVPENAPLIERTLVDMLAATRRLGSRLRDFDDEGRPRGVWDGFVGADLDLEKLASFAESPETTDLGPDEAERFRKPHMALFLAFLGLLSRVQESINGLTRRHLDFYYRRILGMRPKAPLPDRVHLLFEPAGGTDRARVEAGTRVAAGPDSEGHERFYATRRDLMVNRAQVAEVRSARVEREIFDFTDVRKELGNAPDRQATALWGLTLGDPSPGDPLPTYGNESVQGPREVDGELLLELQKQLQFLDDSLFFKPLELRDLMTLKKRRDQADAEWTEINGWLEKAGQTRDPAFVIEPESSSDFSANLEAAAGEALDFAGLPQVRSIDDVYVYRSRPDVRDFIVKCLYFEVPADFAAMMQIKIRIDIEWAEIRRLLEVAANRKALAAGTAPISLTDSESTSFSELLQAALAPDFSSLAPISDLDGYKRALDSMESYFFLSISEIAFVLSVMFPGEDSGEAPGPEDWTRVDHLLTRAHQEKHRSGRRKILSTLRLEAGFDAMIAHVLNERQSPDLLPLLKPYLAATTEFDLLEKAALGDASTDWTQIEWIVEAAWQRREGLPDPLPRLEEWRYLHVAPDATAVDAPSGTESYPSWSTFGPTVADPSAPEPMLGWALSSPSLQLREGRREIRLRLTFEAESFPLEPVATALGLRSQPPQPELSDFHPLKVELSTEEGWWEPSYGTTHLETALDGPPSMDLTLVLGADEPALVAPQDAGPWPVLRVRLRSLKGSEDRPMLVYAPFRDLRLEAVELHVTVKGLKSLIVQNDESLLDASKPFEPFGLQPNVGSRFMFTHPELATQPIDSLTLQARWMGAPEKFEDHYKNFTAVTGNDFTAKVSMVDRRGSHSLVASAALFDDTPDAGGTRGGKIHVTGLASRIQRAPISWQTSSEPTEPLQWDRYFEWRLNAPDFQHSAYPMVATAKALELTRAVKDDKPLDDPAAYQVNPPYTPKLQSLKVDYTFSLDIPLGPVSGIPAGTLGAEDELDRIHHLHPFGYCDMHVDDDGSVENSIAFLPSYDNEGELYVGLQGVGTAGNEGPEIVSVLFQAAEDSADPSLEPAPVQWSRLSGDRWLPLGNKGLLHDSTRGLTTSGILEFELEKGAPSTRLPSELTWLRATVRDGVDGVADTVAFHAQAVAADLVVDASVDPVSAEHFRDPLPAGSIQGLASPNPEISAVHQPYASEGGRSAEADDSFHTRVAERLRHKNRALTAWDYEHLVLEHFPEIFKVKCVSSRAPNDSIGPEETGPGDVTVVVVPDIEGRHRFNPFEPKASVNLLAEIQAFLTDRMPSAVSLKVKNPEYRAVRVGFAVRFRDVVDEGFHRRRLSEDLDRFLSPWAFGEGRDLGIGGRIYAHSIVDFLDRRPYVDYIADLRLFKDDGQGNFRPVHADEDGTYYVSAERPDAILVSGRDHSIIPIPEGGAREKSSWTGIGFMKIELDFIVT